jgi:hypothetical protein
MITFESIQINDKRYNNTSLIGEVNVFQTINWLNFVAERIKGKPIILVIKSDGKFQGYFTGLLINKLGFKILGSPFRGSLTYFMGFNLLPDAPKHEILHALPKFAFSKLGCHYIEIIDPNLSSKDWDELPYKFEYLQYYGIDLSISEDELFANMDSTGRNCIRKSIKSGVVIEEASDVNFANEYYAQYEDVLVKRSLVPTYSLISVRKLVESLLPTGNILLLRALNDEGKCIATGIFLALNKTAIFWGAASWRQYQYLRPNEPIAWYGMKEMKARGVQVLHFGGKCEHYKKKLGATELPLYRIMKSKNQLMDKLLYTIMSPKNEEYRNILLKYISR